MITTTLTTTELIFVIIGVTTTVNLICRFLFWLDTPHHNNHDEL